MSSNYRSPTRDELETPLFNAIWDAIKGWDLERFPGSGRHGANGSDVCHIIDAIAALEAVPEERPIPSTGITRTVVKFVNQRIDSELAKIKDHVSKQSERFADVIIMIDELTGQVNGLKSRVGSKDDLLVRLQKKVENIDSRIDLNVEYRKRVSVLEDKFSRLSGMILFPKEQPEPSEKTRELARKVKERIDSMETQPFDPTALPKVGDYVMAITECDKWPEGEQRKVIWVSAEGFLAESGRERINFPYVWSDSCFRRVDPATIEPKSKQPLPPFQDVEKFQLAPNIIRASGTVNTVVVLPILDDWELDKQRIRMLVKLLVEIRDAHIWESTIDKTLRECGCDGMEK